MSTPRVAGELVEVSPTTNQLSGSGIDRASLVAQLASITAAVSALQAATIPNATGVASGLMSAADKARLDAMPAAWANTTGANALPGRAIVAQAAAANGWQVSATRGALVYCSVTVATALSLSGGTAGYVVLEICATNSAVAANWQEAGARVMNSQAGSGLVVGLSINQTVGGCLAAAVPPGWFVRLRSVSISGAPTYTLVDGQEMLI